MKYFYLFAFLFITIAITSSQPIDNKDSTKDSQSAFGRAFDEIVVESSLTVRRKPDGARQGRNKGATEAAVIKTDEKRVKRFNKQQPQNQPGSINFSGSTANAQANSNQIKGPLGSFGSSSANSQNQAFNFGPNGLSSSVGLSGTQHYSFPNGINIDVNYGNSGSAVNGKTIANSATNSVVFTNPNKPRNNHT